MTAEFNLNLIRCIITGSKINSADQATLDLLNEAIRSGGITNRLGDVITDTISSGLVNQDRSILYIVRNGIPLMIDGDCIPLNQLKERHP